MKFYREGAIVLVAIVALVAWAALRMTAWYFVSSEVSYVTALAGVATLATAAFTAAAALAALIYVILTYQLWDQSHKAQQTTLMLQLMREYDERRDDITAVREFWMANNEQTVETFRRAKRAADPNDDIIKRIDWARFRISRFFVGMRKLSETGFLERPVIVAALDRTAIERVFLPFVDPLDQVIRAVAYGSGDRRDREFFTALLKDYDNEDARRQSGAQRKAG